MDEPERQDGPEEQEAPDTSSRALVVVVNSPRDFDFAREQGWYRIPVARAPAQIGAEYLGFYFTQAFGDERWSVRYYAPVRRLRLVRRVDLLPQEPEHPRAREHYYRFDIGRVEALPRPIPSLRLRRITFIPTSLEKLLSAEEINDLWMREPVQERLWQALKDSGWWPEYLWELSEGKAEYSVSVTIPCKQGAITVLVGPPPAPPPPPPALALDALEITGNLAACLRRVRAEVEQLGGPTPPGPPAS